MPPRMRVKLNQPAINALGQASYVKDRAQQMGDQIASRARQYAPKDTGAGAASIHAETVAGRGGTEVRVSWDQAHYYMRFQEEGTEKIPPKSFLRRAARSIVGRTRAAEKRARDNG